MRARERVLAVIPVYGHTAMTHALLGDLQRERSLVDSVVVDNLGDYQPLDNELVVRPGTNLGWAGGTNLGTVEGRSHEHTAMLWLNNDTRLSDGFVAGLLAAAADTGAGVVGPFYDCHWFHQRDPDGGPATTYRPRRRHYVAPFIDGTAMLVTAGTVDAVGLLDAERFAPLGWGAEIDFCLTVRTSGRQVIVTRSAYLNHRRSVTATALFADGYGGYLDEALPTAVEGLTAKWGDRWQERTEVDEITFQTSARRRRHILPLTQRVLSVVRP